MFPAARHNNLIGVCVDDEIGVVCNDDDLPSGLRLFEPFDQLIINRFSLNYSQRGVNRMVSLE